MAQDGTHRTPVADHLARVATLLAPLRDRGSEEVPLLDKEQLKRERRARAREFHRGIYKEMRARKRDRERRERR